MTKAATCSLIILLLLGLGAPLGAVPFVGCSGVIYVPQDYSTIQAAVDAASAGDTIIVSEGTYAEGQINVGKSLTLEANGTVVVDGLYMGHVFYVDASNVTIRGFVIQNSNDTGGHGGIRLEDWGSSDNLIEGNTIRNSHDAILGVGTHFNTIRNNLIMNNFHGIYLWQSSYNLIVGNRIVNNSKFGIAFEYLCHDNVIADNFVANNECGIGQSYMSYETTIRGNTIQENLYGVMLWNGFDDNVYHNNFVDNTRQIGFYPEHTVLDDGYPSGGNYWSDYEGTDQYSGLYQNETGSDGIGDTPYTIYFPGEQVHDHYPLTKPYHGPYDVGMRDLTITKTIIPENHTMNITLKIINYGLSQETIDFAIQANATPIYTQTITLPARNSTDIAFTWNTTGYARGNYNLTLTAQTLIDNDTSDNLFTFNVRISILGDIDGDDQVDIADIYAAATTYGSYPTHPKWNPNVDLNDDNSVDIMDIYLIAVNFGKTS